MSNEEIVNPGDQIDPTEVAKLPRTYVVLKRRPLPRLYVYKRPTSVSTDYARIFRCWAAIGAVGFATPKGPAMIQKKESPPTYTAPNRQWAIDAGFKPGEKLPHDHPLNPLRGAFLWITHDGVGIHGTANLLSLKTRASHGCIRVSEENALWIYQNVEIGSPVYLD